MCAVKTGKAQREQMFSALPPKAEITLRLAPAASTGFCGAKLVATPSILDMPRAHFGWEFTYF